MTKTLNRNSFEQKLVPYITKNSLKGMAYDLVTEYLESYSGQKHYDNNLKKATPQNLEALVTSSREEIISDMDKNMLLDINKVDRKYFVEELERELLAVYKKGI